LDTPLRPDDIKLDFLRDSPPEPAANEWEERYQVLIVDDEEEVHKVTRITLRDMVVDGHRLEFHSVYTSMDAQEFLAVHPDVAVVLLDVVMESEEAGFEVVEFLRGSLKNHRTRIILRTGQPGVAPEESVIARYDINDYKSKTELTAQKLFTSMYSCLRSYQDIRRIEENKNGLKKIIDSTSLLFRFRNLSLRDFLNGILLQIAALNGTQDSLIVINKGIEQDRLVERGLNADNVIIAATGKYASLVGQTIAAIQEDSGFDDIFRHPVDDGTTVVTRDRRYIGYHKRAGSVESFIVMVNNDGGEDNTELVELFITNLTLALDNYLLNQDNDQVQREIIGRLTEIVEERDNATAHHARRVSETCSLLAEDCGLDRETLEDFRIASMMHDIGKIGIMDTISMKPGRLTEDEFAAMRKHTSIGGRLLGNSSLSIMKMAASIAETHHERWDGTGYPHGLAGEEIPFLARIVSIVDVFDALTHKRTYKAAWTLDEAFNYVGEQAGKQFDPNLAAMFVKLRNAVITIFNKYLTED
jgi:response regulator RpfG family c-di-GMP phosphodiesterase